MLPQVGHLVTSNAMVLAWTPDLDRLAPAALAVDTVFRKYPTAPVFRVHPEEAVRRGSSNGNAVHFSIENGETLSALSLARTRKQYVTPWFAVKDVVVPTNPDRNAWNGPNTQVDAGAERTCTS